MVDNREADAYEVSEVFDTDNSPKWEDETQLEKTEIDQ